MIAVSQGLPFVQWDHLRSVPLSEGWLAESIDQSATNAGLRDWHLSTDVAKAIASFLRQESTAPLLSVEALQEIIRCSLLGVGYPQIAEEVCIVAPRVNIYLTDIARHAPYELLFFNELQQRLHEAMRVVVRGVRLAGLRPCVKMIESKQLWSRNCDDLSDEIVRFTRAQLQQNAQCPVELFIES